MAGFTTDQQIDTLIDRAGIPTVVRHCYRVLRTHLCKLSRQLTTIGLSQGLIAFHHLKSDESSDPGPSWENLTLLPRTYVLPFGEIISDNLSKYALHTMKARDTGEITHFKILKQYFLPKPDGLDLEQNWEQATDQQRNTLDNIYFSSSHVIAFTLHFLGSPIITCYLGDDHNHHRGQNHLKFLRGLFEDVVTPLSQTLNAFFLTQLVHLMRPVLIQKDPQAAVQRFITSILCSLCIYGYYDSGERIDEVPTELPKNLMRTRVFGELDSFAPGVVLTFPTRSTKTSGAFRCAILPSFQQYDPETQDVSAWSSKQSGLGGLCEQLQLLIDEVISVLYDHTSRNASMSKALDASRKLQQLKIEETLWEIRHALAPVDLLERREQIGNVIEQILANKDKVPAGLKADDLGHALKYQHDHRTAEAGNLTHAHALNAACKEALAEVLAGDRHLFGVLSGLFDCVYSVDGTQWYPVARWLKQFDEYGQGIGTHIASSELPVVLCSRLKRGEAVLELSLKYDFSMSQNVHLGLFLFTLVYSPIIACGRQMPREVTVVFDSNAAYCVKWLFSGCEPKADLVQDARDAVTHGKDGKFSYLLGAIDLTLMELAEANATETAIHSRFRR